MTFFRSAVVLTMVSCFFLTGCGKKRVLPDREVVTGTVTLDDVPLKEGSITFASEEDIAMGLPSSAAIVDGKYEAKVSAGLKQVKISCFAKTAGTSVIDEEFKQLIPAKYNDKSTLEANVSPDKTEFNYELDSK